VFLPLQQDFYSKSRHASPQNSSQIYACANMCMHLLVYIKLFECGYDLTNQNNIKSMLTLKNDKDDFCLVCIVIILYSVTEIIRVWYNYYLFIIKIVHEVQI